MPERGRSSVPPESISDDQYGHVVPATVTRVPRSHPVVGRTRRKRQSSPAAKNGPLAIATIVPIATPVRSTATKNSGVYSATPDPADREQRAQRIGGRPSSAAAHGVRSLQRLPRERSTRW
jgi:hypothetical protein